MHRALFEAGAAPRATVVVEAVTEPGPSLITASSGQAPRQPSHSQQLPQDKQRRDSKVASSEESPPTTSSKLPTRSEGRSCGWRRRAASQIPQVQHVEAHEGVFGPGLGGDLSQPCVDLVRSRAYRAPPRRSPCAQRGPCRHQRTRRGSPS